MASSRTPDAPTMPLTTETPTPSLADEFDALYRETRAKMGQEDLDQIRTSEVGAVHRTDLTDATTTAFDHESLAVVGDAVDHVREPARGVGRGEAVAGTDVSRGGFF